MKIKWQEPVAFAQALARSRGQAPSRRRQWIIAAAAAVATALLVMGFEQFFFWLHKKDMGVPTYFYLVAPVFMGLFLGFLPYMIAAVPAMGIMNEDGLHRNKPIGSNIQREFWPWESLASLSIETVCLEGTEFLVLRVQTRNESGTTLLGLGDAPIDELNQLATQMGKPLKTAT